MRLRPWFIASIGLNFILLAAWYIAHIQEVQIPSVRPPRSGHDFPGRTPDQRPRCAASTLRGTQIRIHQPRRLSSPISRRWAAPPARFATSSWRRSTSPSPAAAPPKWSRPTSNGGKQNPIRRGPRRQRPIARSGTRTARRARPLARSNWETETDVSAWVESNYGLTGPHLGTLPPEIKQIAL